MSGPRKLVGAQRAVPGELCLNYFGHICMITLKCTHTAYTTLHVSVAQRRFEAVRSSVRFGIHGSENIVME